MAQALPLSPMGWRVPGRGRRGSTDKPRGQSKHTPAVGSPGAFGRLRIRPLSGKPHSCLYRHRAPEFPRAVQGAPGKRPFPSGDFGVQRKLFQAKPLLTDVHRNGRPGQGWGALGASRLWFPLSVVNYLASVSPSGKRD